MSGSEEGSARLHDDLAGEIATESGAARSSFGRAVHGLVGHRSDTATAIDEALGADPALAAAHLLRGFGLRVLGRRDLLPAAREALAAARATTAHRGGAREVALADALASWLDGRADHAAARLEARLREAPDDILLVKLVHAIRFIMGDAPGMLASLEEVLPAFAPGSVAAGFARGCLSFALEENRRHEQAEDEGRRALELNLDDVWAVHAVAHVLFERGDMERGAAWLAGRESELAEINNFAGHLAWHEALFLIETGAIEEALEIHDRRVAIYPPHDYRDVSNAASLLLLLEEQGLDLEERWQTLAAIARSRLGDHGLAFADIHYVIALTGAGLEDEAGEFIESMRRSARRRDGDFDAEVLLDVGAPLAEAILDASAGRVGRAIETVRRLGPSIGQIGGSRAQRRVIPWVLRAARRRGDHRSESSSRG